MTTTSKTCPDSTSLEHYSHNRIVLAPSGVMVCGHLLAPLVKVMRGNIETVDPMYCQQAVRLGKCPRRCRE
jgi:hypothetical protein